MLNIGFSEILLFGIIALVVLGPEKLPIAVRTAGRWYAHIRRLVTNVQRDIEQELQLTEMREHMQKELDRIKSMEHNMQQQLDQMHDDLAELNPNAASHDTHYQIRLPEAAPFQALLFKPLSETEASRYSLAPVHACTSINNKNPDVSSPPAKDDTASSVAAAPLLQKEHSSS